MTYPLVPHPHATKEQRSKVLTSTDVKRLAFGDWMQVWQEKTGRTDPVDLRFQWKPRLGLCTEELHGWWHGHSEGVDLRMTEDQPCYNPKLDLPAHYASTYDFWVTAEGIPLETKHLNARNHLRQAAEDYMAQLQWQMLVADVPRLRFSCIFGNEEPVWGYVDRDEDYIARLRQQADAFWEMVVTDIPPGDGSIDETLQELAKAVTINGYRDYDYSLNNEWVSLATDYIRLKPMADECETVKTKLKALVPADGGTVTGAGLKIARNKKGSLVLTVKSEDLDA